MGSGTADRRHCTRVPSRSWAGGLSLVLLTAALSSPLVVPSDPVVRTVADVRVLAQPGGGDAVSPDGCLASDPSCGGPSAPGQPGTSSSGGSSASGGVISDAPASSDSDSSSEFPDWLTELIGGSKPHGGNSGGSGSGPTASAPPTSTDLSWLDGLLGNIFSAVGKIVSAAVAASQQAAQQAPPPMPLPRPQSVTPAAQQSAVQPQTPTQPQVPAAVAQPAPVAPPADTSSSVLPPVSVQIPSPADPQPPPPASGGGNGAANVAPPSGDAAGGNAAAGNAAGGNTAGNGTIVGIPTGK